MSSLKGDFMDSQNIIIINDVPYFSFKGNSYLEKLKNGLSLDVVFLMEDSAVQPKEKFEECVETKQYQPLKHELFVEEYDYDVISMPRKGKRVIKKRCDKNMKKNKVKQNGYDYKMHTIESNLPSLFNESTDLYIDYPDYDDYDYWDDKLGEDDFDEYRDYIEYYRRNSFDSLDEWNNANRTGRGWD
jgi:hypothetical protein